MKKSILIFIFLGSLLMSARGQQERQSMEDEMPQKKGKFFLVPEFWLSFGSSTYIDIAPMIGYHALERLVIGAGPHYTYQSVRVSPGYPFAYETHAFGLKGFGRFALITNAEQFLISHLKIQSLFLLSQYSRGKQQ